MEVDLELVIVAPPAEVAALLFDFEGLAGWHPGLEGYRVEGAGVGAVRRYRLGGGAVAERLDELALDRSSMAYTVLEGPLPLNDFVARYTILDGPEPGTTRVVWTARFAVADMLAQGLASAAALMQKTTLTLLALRLEKGIALVEEPRS